MIINKKFDYKKLERIESEEGRRYLVDGVPLPSVTTILSSVADKSHLDKWINNVGVDKAEKIRNESATLGDGMHKNLERYIIGEDLKGTFMQKSLAKVIIKNAFGKIDEIWGSEVSLYSKGLYAGTTDLVGIHSGIPTIMDFKNSLREKKLEWIEDYRAQIAAYALAHNEIYNTDINRGVIMIATRDAKYQEFIFEGNSFKECVDIWLSKLQKYYKFSINDK